MPLSRAQVETFCGDMAELFSVRPPRISRRRRVRCVWKKRTLHIGRTITRDTLAHELAHYLHRELAWPDGALRLHVREKVNAKGFRKRGGKIHGRTFKAWQRLVGNYIAQEFGEGEGVIL